LDELFPLHIPKDKLPVHDLGNVVIIRGRASLRDLELRMSPRQNQTLSANPTPISLLYLMTHLEH
jgi:hypothetical protein